MFFNICEVASTERTVYARASAADLDVLAC